LLLQPIIEIRIKSKKDFKTILNFT